MPGSEARNLAGPPHSSGPETQVPVGAPANEDSPERHQEPVLNATQAAGISFGVFATTTLTSGYLVYRLRRRELASSPESSSGLQPLPKTVDAWTERGTLVGDTAAVQTAAVRTASLALLSGTLLCASFGYIGWRLLLWYTGTNDLENFATALKQPNSMPKRLRRSLEEGSLGRSLRNWYASMTTETFEDAGRSGIRSIEPAATGAVDTGTMTWLQRVANRARRSGLILWFQKRMHGPSTEANGHSRPPRETSPSKPTSP
jgi:hypothetical protein